tara:strand:- start:118 stop:360 length:243 start_codon:yes stop_codon:yes gene_type:complete
MNNMSDSDLIKQYEHTITEDRKTIDKLANQIRMIKNIIYQPNPQRFNIKAPWMNFLGCSSNSMEYYESDDIIREIKKILN